MRTHSEDSRAAAPMWTKAVLLLAAAYNLIWGTVVIFAPEASLRWCGFPESIRYPQIWQCLGMVVGVYGIGYGIAAFDPYRHWPVVLVGLLGKVFGPIGMAASVLDGSLPPSAAKTILFNDLIWWIPFTVILWKAAAWHRSPAPCSPRSGDPA